MRRYLLGEMTEAERAALEREYFADGRLFELMVRAENELVDEYARGLLPPPARERFERHYLSHPARRARARFAEALAAKLGETGAAAAAEPPHAKPLWRSRPAFLRAPALAWALSAALLLAAAGAAWLRLETRAPRHETAKTEVPRAAQETRAGEPPAPVADGRPADGRPPAEPGRTRTEQRGVAPAPTPAAKPAPTFATLVLTIGSTRSAGAAPHALLAIPARTEKARLQLNLRESDYKSYRAALKAVGGTDVYAWERVNSRVTKSGVTITLTVPARMLADGDYLLTLSGVGESGELEDVSKSLFRVRKD